MDWIKIMCNILDHRKIKMIRKGPEGNTLVLLWLLILIEAGKCNRGGYLMVSDHLPYSAETLGMVTDIPLPTVQLGLATFASLDMIDRQDSVIYIKNWPKYQSEDKFEVRRENDRKRQQKHRQEKREKLIALQGSDHMSRDSDVTMSRDVTLENRGDKNRGEETTTDRLRMLLSGTPLTKISDQELNGLLKRHGLERLMLAADVASETWRRNKTETPNPGGYLQKMCINMVVPEWYVPVDERTSQIDALRQRKATMDAEKAALRVEEEAQMMARNAFWQSLSDQRREEYNLAALEGLAANLAPSMAVLARAKILAWEASHLSITDDLTGQTA